MELAELQDQKNNTIFIYISKYNNNLYLIQNILQ